MYADISKPAPPLPTADLQTIAEGIKLLPPLTRRGHGPGLIILTEPSNEPLAFHDGVPSPLTKWAEEGYTVAQLDSSALGSQSPSQAWKAAATALARCEKCEPQETIGVVAYNIELWNKMTGDLTSSIPNVAAAIVYANAAQLDTLATAALPTLRHVSGDASKSEVFTQYTYPKTKSSSFAIPGHEHFHYATESLSHTRSLQFLKSKMNGPYFDLETIWDEHTYYEFADRSVEHTMSTMVQEPYVNHVPTLTGGIGREKLSHFYAHNFIFNNSADTELELLSRTIGIDRVIDEFIFKFTHDQEIDWILPGVPPTNLKVEIPFTAVVNIRGDRLYHEHIAWDQASVLRQLDLLPEYLPFPHALPQSYNAKPGVKYEYRLPVAGVETASKMRERDGVPSNQMFEYQIREAKN